MSEPRPKIVPTAEPLMAGKRGLIMGVANDRSLAWGIARSVAEHGAELAFTYQGEALARRVGPLAESLGSNVVLPCDVNDDEALDTVFDDIAGRWDGLDFLVHAIVKFKTSCWHVPTFCKGCGQTMLFTQSMDSAW